MILYALYVDAIFFPCHPYIWSTTVLHDMQGGMNSAISPDESTRPDDSKTLLFVPDTPLRFGAIGL